MTDNTRNISITVPNNVINLLSNLIRSIQVDTQQQDVSNMQDITNVQQQNNTMIDESDNESDNNTSDTEDQRIDWEQKHQLSQLTLEPKQYEYYEVVRVLNHKYDRAYSLSYELLWSTGDKTWVKDEDCFCEELIGVYNKNNNIKTAHIMCRVSTERQADNKAVSLEAQETSLVQYALTLGNIHRIKVTKYCCSAFKSIPDKIKDLEYCINKCDVIMVHSVDRLSRNLVNIIAWADKMVSKGVKIYALRENISYNEHKTVFMQYLVAAQSESETISSRIKAAFKLKRGRGEHIGRLPYGKRYKKTPWNKDPTVMVSVIEDHPEELEIINEIMRKSATKSFSEIALGLNSNSKLKRNRRWNKSMIKYIIKSNKMQL